MIIADHGILVGVFRLVAQYPLCLFHRLNVAIEAARTDKNSKGFSVATDEVCKLAERAANFTKEITFLVKNIQNTIDEAMLAMETVPTK